MTFVVLENCIRCKYMDCVDVCPVDCFHEGPNFLVIDPEECIDCTLCEPECPAEAIVAEDDIPPGQEQFLEQLLHQTPAAAMGEKDVGIVGQRQRTTGRGFRFHGIKTGRVAGDDNGDRRHRRLHRKPWWRPADDPGYSACQTPDIGAVS